MLYSLGTFPKQQESYRPWIKRSAVSPQNDSLLIFSHREHPSSPARNVGNTRFFFFLHICVYFLLVKPRSVLSADGCLGSPDIPPRGLQSERTEKRSLPSFVQFALHLSSYRGSHDITFLPSPLSLCSSSFFFFFFCAVLFHIAPSVVLKKQLQAPALWIHQKRSILWSSAIHLAQWHGHADGQQCTAGNDTWYMCFWLHDGV